MAPGANDSLLKRYQSVRNRSEDLARPLTVEDQVVQTMPDVSPTKWHLAHTSWFFETFVLAELVPDYKPFHPKFRYLFNSYYNAVGPQFSRPHRGTLSRPTVDIIMQYRAHVDDQMFDLLAGPKGANLSTEMQNVIVIGTHHEQQHQELILTDIKHVLGSNPLFPSYRKRRDVPGEADSSPAEWMTYDGGVHELGFDGEGFSFDNEGPRHRTFLQPFQLASRPVSVGEYLAFMNDGGYERPEFWLSDAWATIQREGWNAPLYWHKEGDDWHNFTLAGLLPVDPSEPVCHVSYYEADAFATWAGARLPTEAEWEFVGAEQSTEGNFVDSGIFHPVHPSVYQRLHISEETNSPVIPASSSPFRQMFGDVWEWTQSPYTAYPGYKAAEGAIGEYNGKFMSSQMVLRGGSCATSHNHIRPTYRNFFPPHARWQFSGFRLAR